jgi:hypothetical protein
LRLAVALAALAMASPAHAAPISAHAMVHTCCTPTPMKERIFSEAKALGTAYIRVDIELSGIFAAPDAEPNWTALDETMELSRRHDLPVLGILLAPPAGADEADFGVLAGEVAGHAKGTIDHWEILNEPDADWAFDGTPEEYARMLSASYDAIKATAPDDTVLLGGLARPHEPGWLERVFATPGADALHKFDVAGVHLRGPVDAVVRRYGEFKAWLAARGFEGPLWVTEHGYPADPAFQVDRAYTGGDAAQAAYLTQALVGLGEAGAPQVFVTLRDNPELGAQYVSEGLVGRASFAAVQRLVQNWDQVMAWRDEQRENEREQRLEQAAAAISASEARSARAKFRVARLRVHAAQDEVARPLRSRKLKARLSRRLARARAMLAGRRTMLLWHSAHARWHWDRATERGQAVELLKQRIAGG